VEVAEAAASVVLVVEVLAAAEQAEVGKNILLKKKPLKITSTVFL
jgi:hypothetical protein